MKIINLFYLLVPAIILGVFFRSDSDLTLFFTPSPPAQAYAGEVVWIVGASSGIGAALALELARFGAHVVLSARRAEQLQALAQQIVSAGGPEPLVLPFDVTQLDTHQTAFDQVLSKFGKLDVLVLNAGRSQRNLAVETPFEVTRDILELNFFSLVHLNKVVLPKLIEQKKGQIVVMSSVSGLLGTTVASSYSASKYALHGYFNALRSEVSLHNVAVSLVCPGPVETEISSHSFVNPGYPRQKEGKKMSAERCASLVVRGLYRGQDEMWISDQPVLSIAYLSVYAPGLTRKIFSHFLGPARVKALQGGHNIYDFKAIVSLGLKKSD
eukprot:gene8449-9315_t